MRGLVPWSWPQHTPKPRLGATSSKPSQVRSDQARPPVNHHALGCLSEDSSIRRRTVVVAGTHTTTVAKSVSHGSCLTLLFVFISTSMVDVWHLGYSH
ncbi:hypothetical protein K456DRAFT_774297 [Colletotrichum gloeosporioides 23]|nr:hypothetical protein K456DRAFT_774297 [Colletotrichum gloeosporioides 23]